MLQSEVMLMVKSEYHRIHMRAADGDHVTIFLPLAPDGRFDHKGVGPFLLKALWGGSMYVAELNAVPGELNRIVWAEGAVDSLTDLGTAPVRRGGTVRIYESDSTESDYYEFVVREVTRV
jgi:hypothetical protein